MARGYFKEFAISPDDWPASIRQVGTELAPWCAPVVCLDSLRSFKTKFARFPP